MGIALILAGCSQLPPAPDVPTDTAEPSASPALVAFTSERYGYTIRHPADWEVLERPGDLSLPALRPRNPGTDTIGTPDSHTYDAFDGIVMVAARDLEAGESLVDFTTEASGATACGPHGTGTATLGGEPAELRKFECGGTWWHQITAVHDGRGYLVWIFRPHRDDFLTSFAFTD